MRGKLQKFIPAAFEPSEILDTEIWVCKKPQRGDHIRVSRGAYNHHGIYVSDEEVIHFTGTEDDDVFGTHNEVLKSDLDFFLKLGELQVKVYTQRELADLYPVEGIVEYARTCLGDEGYNLFFNNCEHFANACTLGRHRSRQASPGGILQKAKDFLFGEEKVKIIEKRPDEEAVKKIQAETEEQLQDIAVRRQEIMAKRGEELAIAKERAEIALDEIKREGQNRIFDTAVEYDAKIRKMRQQAASTQQLDSGQKDREEEYQRELAKIEEERKKFYEVTLKGMEATLSKFPKGSGAYKLFAKRIEDSKATLEEKLTRQRDALKIKFNFKEEN